MAQGELIRRLAAIVVADIAGYSRLMEGDEAGTLARLQQLREEIIDPKMAEYRGRIVKTMGDGMLVEFASVTDALKSCVEMQEALLDRNATIPAERRIEFRVGVNLGEIIIEGADIYGTGVNVAARLETLAEPGGIRISGSVHDQIRTILSLDYEDMGEQTVKNISAPVRSYAVRSAVPVSATDPTPAPAPALQAAKSGKPSIAVLPFENLSGDSEQEYFADGITEDLITTLSQIGQLSVVSRNSAFTFKNRAVSAHDAGGELNARYVVTGSLRKSGNRIRVTVQLTDTETEEHLWSNRYDRGLEDVFAVQDEITLTIATALQVELTEGEQAKLRYTTTGNVAAWTLFIRGLSLFRTVSADTYRHARDCFEQALAEDPDSAQIRAMLACVHAIEGRFHWTPDRDESLRMAKELADQALAIDDGNADAWAALGYWHMSYLRLDESVAAYARAVEIAPDHADLRALYALALTFAERPDDAVREVKHAIELNPLDPGWYRGVLGHAYRYAGRLDEALAILTEYNRHGAGFGLVDMVLTCADMGEMEPARAHAKALLAERPDFAVANWEKTQNCADPGRLDTDRQSLVDAGLP